MMCLRGPLAAVILLTGLSYAQDAATAGLTKKLIEYGWDVPTTDFVRAHVREMEQRPFDGLIFKLKTGGNVLEPTAVDEAALAEDFDNLANIAWEKFTDNFIILWAASSQDWFDDAHWKAIEHNVALAGKAARIGKCVGVCFDAEPYGTNPWAYKAAAHKDTKSFAEYQAQARLRGAQFIKALESEFPNPQILTFYQLGLFAHLCKPMPAEDREKSLSEHDYSLLPAFTNGMLEAAGPGVRFTDGNENAYYYSDESAYFRSYHDITQGALYLVDPALRAKYRAQVQVGQALYVDQYFGLRTQPVLGNYMTPKEQPLWFEHNVFWALSSSDHYVWCYSERMNWWTNTDIPEGSEAAIRSARDKVEKGQPLGFDLRPIVNAADKRSRGVTEP
ncbi:MAG: hypothetical protein K1Y02_17375 [Candidatus Hydrogenedentes bacterium]|nr:hypothetical protein [Candidatus Hydrogenedentota bacterium]